MNEPEGTATAATTASGVAATAPAGAGPEQESRQERRGQRRRPFVPPRPSTPSRPPGPPQLDFPPVRNGLDYLASVVKHLDETESEVTPSDVKYAVLHLQAAVEVLFKARLLAEHWTLVFTHPGDATSKALDDATLKSVTPEQAITRLKNIAGVPISDKEEKALTRLTTDRNKLQHFGLTDNARAVEARAGAVLDFLIRFIEDQLLPYLDEPETTMTERELDGLREGLNNINSYVRQRMNRIGGELKAEGAEHRTIECISCQEMALVVQPRTASGLPDDWGDRATCRFCSTSWPPQGLHLHFRGQGTPWEEADICPMCGEAALGFDVRVRSESEPVSFCFCCATVLAALVPCDACGKPIDASAAGSPPLCRPCEDAWESDSEPEYGLPYEDPADYGFDEGTERPAHESSGIPGKGDEA
ncbi:serine/arginine repetitive matrix protein 1 [Streptomyces hydrogenans]|uniref:serine/arginine repetitive matrix protein 1 n=1 Tax=Streptomyces hydrogenans TaxID=1873719 RepID=UPI00363D10C1